MQKISIFLFIFILLVGMNSCSYDHRKTKDMYMPDMSESRSYQTYTGDSFYREKIGDKRPIGTVSQSQNLDLEDFDYPNTPEGYQASMNAVNPMPNPTIDEMREGKRLYAIYCGICHGEKLDGNGPLYKDGNGPYIVKPAALIGQFATAGALHEGSIYFTIRYGGRTIMGSHASQLDSKQSWMIVDYIKMEQQKAAAIVVTNKQ